MINSNDSSTVNKLDYLHRLLENNSSQSMFYGFRADPPTTTSQRLKGLLTGTLPTFFDFGSNFNNDLTLHDDNIIDQFISNMINDNPHIEDNNDTCSCVYSAKSICIGDDTWKSLFPSKFDLHYPFDSFNTNDIYSVDDGIEKVLKEIFEGDRNDSSIHSRCNATVCKESCGSNQTDWRLLIAHYLSIDHVGHTYSSSHPLMTERLKYMNQSIKYVIDHLPNDTLLVIFGDHGMTEDGNHGGSSVDETDSGLFLYSNTPFIPTLKISGHSLVSDSSEDSDMSAIRVPYWNDHRSSMEWTKPTDILRNPRIISQVMTGSFLSG